jgi:hypothetical protein
LKILILVALISLPAFAAKDLRSELQTAAAKKDKDFPDGKGVKLTRFAHVCDLATKGGLMHVVDQRAVLTGMLAPRGRNKISFYDEKLRLTGQLRYIQSAPLWCEGGKLYLFGGLDGGEACKDKLKCNVVDWGAGGTEPKLLHEKMYGSSGGVEDL